jgi:hypothetical protein
MEDQDGADSRRHEQSDERINERAIGLCLECHYSRRIISARGRAFFRCDRSKLDSSLEVYPTLPVTECTAFRNTGSEAEP